MTFSGLQNFFNDENTLEPMDEVHNKDPDLPDKPYRKKIKKTFIIIVIVGIIILFFYVVYYVSIIFLSALLMNNNLLPSPMLPGERLHFTYDGIYGKNRISGNSFLRNTTVHMSGWNTASDKVYLMITGPEIGQKTGANLNDPAREVINDDPSSFDTVIDVYYTQEYGSDSWFYNWRTNSSILPPGTYTIFALSQPKDKNHLDGIDYHKEVIVLE